jgi:hypothetical protein
MVGEENRSTRRKVTPVPRFPPQSPYVNLNRSKIRYKRLSSLYFCLPTVADTTHIQLVILLLIQNLVRICKQITILILHWVTYWLVATLAEILHALEKFPKLYYYSTQRPSLPKLQAFWRLEDDISLYPFRRLTSWDWASLYEICEIFIHW